MLSIGKLGQGQERYYLEAVAEGAEDYYVYAGEAPGRWAGGGSASLGLNGEVAGEDFTALLRGTDPATGQPLGRRHAVAKVPGFDLTFSAPKSVSLLFALGGDDLSHRMRDAHDSAVADALGYLERTAGHGRRGHAGSSRIATTGFVAALFRHRTSRAGDPNLHTHAVVSNRVLGLDGRWSALDAQAIYAQAKTAGTLYEASLRHHLRDLGLSWTVAPSGLAEIDGVPYEVRRAFSRRRQQIEAHLDEWGLSSARAAQVATLQTRAAKDHEVDADTLSGQWRQRAAELGFTPNVIEALLLQGRERLQSGLVDDEVLSRLLSPYGLTARSSSFGEREVLRAVANALPDGGSVDQVESLTRALLASAEVVELATWRREGGRPVLSRCTTGHGVVPLGASGRRWSTRQLLGLERDLLGRALAGQRVGAAQVPEELVSAALARRPLLNDEQRHLVHRLAVDGDEVVVVNAAAGSGKTTALDSVTEAFQAAGRPVLGATLSAKAAGVLRDETGMPTFTLTRLLLDLEDARSGGLPGGAVLVVDEAGQVGTRTLHALHQHVRQAGGKLVLVGDVHQLPEIEAGGAFRGLVQRLDVVELQANHRQREAEERERLRELRSGDVGTAMTAYDAAGRITRADTSDALREQLMTDWAAAYGTARGPDSVVMLGLTNHDVDDLNERARRLLLASGELGTEELVLAGRGFRVGDRVVTRRNDYRLGVLNGQRWTVAGWDDDALVLSRGSEEPLRLPHAYAQAGPDRLQHAYALTTSLAQGSTVDRAFVLGSDATYREAGYTAASRARDKTQFYVVQREQDERCEERHGSAAVDVVKQDPLREMTTALERSAAQYLAVDSAPDPEPRYVTVATGLERGRRTSPPKPRGATAVADVEAALRNARDQLEIARADRGAGRTRQRGSWLLGAGGRAGRREEGAASARERLWAIRVEQLEAAALLAKRQEQPRQERHQYGPDLAGVARSRPASAAHELDTAGW